MTLLDWCFENYSYRSIVERGYPAATQPIEKDGRRGEITLVCSQEINALAEKALDAATLKSEVTLYAETLTDVPAEGTELGKVTFSDPGDGTVYGTVTLVSQGEARFEEPEPQTVRPQELSREQKLATVIVCSIAVFLLLVFILLLVRRSRRMRRKRR